jgi:hypothetical protein
MQSPFISLHICPGATGAPPVVHAEVLGHAKTIEIMGGSDTAMVARAMLQSAAYLFAQGQPVQFGAEVPVEALK